MSEIPEGLYYTVEHEWLQLQDDGNLVVGITDHAQQALGELVYFEAPEIGKSFDKDGACAVVESVKAASDVFCPVAGEITEVNDALVDEPELINSEPYAAGWMFKMQPVNARSLDELLSADDYQQLLAKLEED